MAKKNPRTGSMLEGLLGEYGLYEETENRATKSILAHKLIEAMKTENISKSQMAERMMTSRSQLDRLLDPDNESVTLATLQRAATAVGMRLELRLKPGS